MKLTTPLLVAASLLLMTVGICFADTLVITYRSGKTQTITLDEPGAAINSWQFVGQSAASVPQQQPAKTENTAAPSQKAEQKEPEKKPNIRVNWSAKPISD